MTKNTNRSLEQLFSESSAAVEAESLMLKTSEALLELLDGQNVTRTELAQRIGKTKGHVSQILNGERNMTLRTLSEVLFALGHRLQLQTQPLAEDSWQFRVAGAATETPAAAMDELTRWITGVKMRLAASRSVANQFIPHWNAPDAVGREAQGTRSAVRYGLTARTRRQEWDYWSVRASASRTHLDPSKKRDTSADKEEYTFAA
jgi:transcriptional regulator with XRE-family HTH domain